MKFLDTALPGAYVIEPQRIEDSRGFFARVFAADELEARGLCGRVVQSNLSFNRRRGTVRGMHFQRAPHAETKLVRCTQGALYDVIVDLRPDSPSFKQHIGIELTADNHTMLYVPEGFGHGFQTLVDATEIFYQVSAAYAAGAGGGVRWNDPALGIKWPLEPTVISDQDRAWSDLRDDVLVRAS